MSAFVEVAVGFDDLPCLVAALKELGYDTVETHDKPQNLHGYRGDKRKQKAHLIVRKKHIGGSSNDLGFTRTAQGKYSMVISEYDQMFLAYKHGCPQYGFENLLKQKYTLQKLQKEAKKGRWKMNVEAQALGQPIRVTLTRWA